MTIYVDRVIEERNIDAALYILTVLLGLKDEVLSGRRDGLMKLKRRLENSHKITDDDRKLIVRAYNEVMYK